jgi:hypothetical protein
MIYLAAATVLVCLYIFDVQREDKKEKMRESAKLIFRMEADHLDSVTLRKGKHSVILDKSGVTDQAGWRVVSPLSTGTDDFAVEQLKNRLARLKYQKIISENAADLSQFGLDQPGFTVTYATNAKEEVSLSFGFRSPIEDAFYASKGNEKKIYLIAAGDREDLDKSLFDLRDKGLFTIESHNVNQVVIDGRPGTWVLSKKDGKWLIDGEEDFRIDQDKVASLIRRTLWEEASSFENEKADDLRPYGLERPRARITFSDGQKSEQILLGDDFKPDEEERIYAMMVGKPQVVTVKKKILEDLPGKKDEIKEKEEKDEEKTDLGSENNP